MNILITSHAHLSDGLVEAFRMFASNCPLVHSVCLGDRGVDEFRADLSKEVESLLSQGKLLIMSDLLGGTPYNESYVHAVGHPQDIKLVAGVNLPMLVEAGVLAMSLDDLDAVYEAALTAGAAGVSGATVSDEAYSPEEDDLF
ncbi:hypothetical protein [uncultured Parolsenella sp.]|uniref:PTS sugar transporter subunit IIA n=1 Tax=uncultured Parolsenella sp. TaxID=2083008 RepID=UPI0027D98BBE|nr:hypothetical protein [uncultured Parolsenella sp.]